MTQSNLNQAGLEQLARKAYGEGYTAGRLSNNKMGEINHWWHKSKAKAAIAAYLECVDSGWKDINEAPALVGAYMCFFPHRAEPQRIYAVHKSLVNARELGATHFMPLPQPPTTGDLR